MTKVQVIVDSAAALPREVVERAALQVVPLRLNIGERSYADGDLPLEEVVARLDDGVKTSAPSPGEWSAAFERALAGADRAVVLTVSAAMSSTYGAARLAASDFGSRVEVIDTGTAAGAEGLVALAAAQVAGNGGNPPSVIHAASRVVDQVKLVATMDSLDQLVRGGRVPSLAGWAGRRLGVNPLFEFAHGQVHPLRPAFSQAAALDRLVHAVSSSAPDRRAVLRVAALHAVAPHLAGELVARLRATTSRLDAYVASFSPVMVAHTGAGLVGLAWWWDDALVV